MRDIKRRRSSIQSTGQITRAMKLVATVKLQKAREKAEHTRPYSDGVYQTMQSILERSAGISHPYLQGGDNEQIVQAATEDNQIPVVFSAVSDPVGAGLVESLDAPGANLTGTSDYLDTASIMKLIEAVNPDTKKIGLLYDIGQDSSTAAIEAAKAYMDENGIEYVERTGTTTDEVQLAADALVADGVDAVFTPTDNTIMTAELSIYEKFIDAGIPHYTGADSFALNGAFAGYGVDYANLGAKTADMIADILLNGADPATTPVETFDNGTATVNTETCEALGLDFETVKAAMEPLCTQVNEITTAESFDELEEN